MIVTLYDTIVVVQAFAITTGIFISLTLFTLQSKYDFSGLGPYLFAGLIGCVISGFVQLFLPYNSLFHFALSVFGSILFSLYIVFDTYMISSRLSPDEYIIAVVELYLDFVNLFLYILRLLSHFNNNRN